MIIMQIKRSIACLLILFISVVGWGQESKRIFLSSDTSTHSLDYKDVVQAIILSSNKVYCYAGKRLDSGEIFALTPTNEFRQFIVKAKHEHGKNLLVIIKPSPGTNYSGVVDVLDEMSINAIEKFVLVDLSEEERKKFGADSTFGTNDLFASPPKVTMVQSPKSVSTTTTSEPDNAHVAIIFEFHKFKQLSYCIKTQMDSTKAVIPMSQGKIESVITKARSLSAKQGKSLLVTIKADNNVEYSEFKPLIDGLRAKKIYKYRLISTSY